MKNVISRLCLRSVFFLFIAACNVFAVTHGYISRLSDLDGENSGHSVAYFLTLPVSAGELSLGSASCGLMDATDVYSFIANTAFFDRREFAATHLEWLMGLRKEFVSACFPVEDIGTFGIFSQAFTPGTFGNAYTIDETPSNPSLIDYSVGLTMARGFFHNLLSAGGSFSYLESRLDGTVGRTVCLNADCAMSPSPFVFLHIRAGNLGPGLSYTGNITEALPLQTGCSALIKPFAAEDDLSGIIDPQLCLGVSKLSDEPLNIGASAQAGIFNFLKLRFGYEYALKSGQTVLEGLSAGVGLEQNNYGADLGWKGESEEFGSVWSVSVKAQLRPVNKKKAEDYYCIAQRLFDEGRMRQSLNNAKKAIALDPNMWKAHVLVSTITSIKRRKNGTEIAIIYTGNINGIFSPVMQNNNLAGGLARSKTIIDRMRSEFPYLMVVEAGNFLSQTSIAAKAPVAAWYFKQCAYNAVAIGKGELDFGPDRIFAKNMALQCGYCCTNLSGSYSGLVRKITTDIKGHVFYIMAVTGQNLPAGDNAGNKIADPAKGIRKLLDGKTARNADVRMLIVNDSWERACEIARTFPEIGIILCGGLKQRFETPMKAGNAIVLSPGFNGACVGKLIIRFNDDKKIESYDNHLVSLDNNIPPDSAMAAILGNIPDSSGMEYADKKFSVKDKPSGVFAFVSNRDGKPGIFLKILDQMAEFPLTRGKNECFSPVISFQNNSCAYFEKTNDTSCPVLRVMTLGGAAKWTVPFKGCASCAKFSPDGQWLYFSVREDSSNDDIYRIRPEGSEMQQIVNWKNSSEKYFDFSPNGLYMVFCSNGNGKNQIYITDTIGRKPICISEGNADNLSPRFDPSGKRIAFLSNRTNLKNAYDLWVYDIESGGSGQITVNSDIKDFCWVDDSRAIIFSSGDVKSTLKSIDPNTGIVNRLIPKDQEDTVKYYSERTPRLLFYRSSWKIIYTREYPDGDMEIFQVNKDGSVNQRIVNSTGSDWLE
ncbi:MAG TPA: hypothetical protein DCO75_09150 [Fibrobacteres bacterium]|jgi:hypothetical protein|nr:hypothetical protein [Fibrobacterota bacterium]